MLRRYLIRQIVAVELQVLASCETEALYLTEGEWERPGTTRRVLETIVVNDSELE